MIKAVLFDVGGTLIKYDVEHAGEIFHRILTSLGIPRQLDEVKTAFMNAEREAEGIHLLSYFGKMQCEEYWNRWNSLVLKHLEITEHVELGKTVQSKWFDFVDFTLYPEVEDVLSRLKEGGLKIGLVSTAYEQEIHLILEKIGLAETVFDVIVGVDTIMKVKPDPDIFKHAVRRLGLKPEEVIFVGDSVEADYKGAENAGLHSLLIVRTGKKLNGLRTVGTLEEIFHLIKPNSSATRKKLS